VAEKRNPTNFDLLTEIRSMNTRIAALESWKIAEDAAKKAVADYVQKEETQRMANLEVHKSREWIALLKQAGVVLGIVISILYAYAATKGIRP
jgi:hypothetical protein